MNKVLISACLVGEKVRYNGDSSAASSELLKRWQREGRLVPFCPEVAGGLPVPRPPAEIIDGDGREVLAGKKRVITINGQDVTEAYLAGAYRTLETARAEGVVLAIMKADSPACGSGRIHSGKFDGQMKAGDGVAVALLKQNGIPVFTEMQLAEAQQYLERIESESPPAATG